MIFNIAKTFIISNFVESYVFRNAISRLGQRPSQITTVGVAEIAYDFGLWGFSGSHSTKRSRVPCLGLRYGFYTWFRAFEWLVLSRDTKLPLIRLISNRPALGSGGISSQWKFHGSNLQIILLFSHRHVLYSYVWNFLYKLWIMYVPAIEHSQLAILYLRL